MGTSREGSGETARDLNESVLWILTSTTSTVLRGVILVASRKIYICI